VIGAIRVKHLVSLVDGTWQTPTLVAGGNISSNIHRINLLLQSDNDRNPPQIVFYSRGLGAVSGIHKYTAGGFASNIKEGVEDVYMNIASNYVDGDKIYLFGFSRGAVIARVVASLISNTGLLYSSQLDKFPDIWSLYKSGGRLDHEPPPTHCHREANVEFLGVFDTVCGGNDTAQTLKRRLKFAGKRLSENVKNAVHILAMDDQRPFFRPLPWEDSDNHPNLKQIWMPGVHGDIGGTYPASFLGELSLLTIVCEATSKTKLAFDMKKVGLLKNSVQQALGAKNVNINQEWTPFWQIISLYRKNYRTPPNVASKQFLHFIASELSGDWVNIRNEKSKQKYRVPHGFSSLPWYQNSLDI
jgi:uncharacterized protein (DUF2235 family)